MMRVAWIEAVALIGPGLHGWPAAQPILAARSAYVPSATLIPPATALPATERRRTGRSVRLALAVGLDAARAASRPVAALATVFASSGGDGENCHALCETLASTEPQLSPTRFHNSVHNAPAGYWGIATGAHAPATALCAHDASFAAGLLEAFTQVLVDGAPVLLVAHDDRYPAPLAVHRPIPDALGVALALAPARSAASIATLSIELDKTRPQRLEDPQLERLRAAIPAARSLPLLQAIALCASRRVAIEYLGTTSLCAEVEPC